MNIVCEVCGHIGFRHLLLCCRDCKLSATHQYCLDRVVFDASLIEWFCHECLQRHSEVTCIRSLEKVPSEKLPSHAHFGSKVYQPITKIVESARDAGPWRNRKGKSIVTKYASLSRICSSRKKHTKNKSNMPPMGNCMNGEGRIAKITAHKNAKASYSCETIGTESAKSNNGKNQQADHENPVLEESGSKLHSIKDSCANHDNQKNQHVSVGHRNMEVKSVKDKKTVVGEDQNKHRTAGSVRNRMEKYEVHGDSNSNRIDSLMPERETEDELPQGSMAANVPQLSSLQNDAADKVMPYSPNDGGEGVFFYTGTKNVPSVKEISVDSVDISSISEHDTTEASESSERLTKCKKSISCRHEKNLKMAAASSSSEESGQYEPSENVSLESDDHQLPLGADYVLSYRSYLSKAQKIRVLALIQEIKPEHTPYIATMRRTTVQPPGPYLGITKEYALAYFPDKSTRVTLEMPGKSKNWHPKFYKRDENRKNFLMGQWLDFVRDNHVQEGDIVLLLPTKGGKRSTFTVYLFHETATHSRGRTGFQRVGSCPGGFSTKTASKVHTEEEATTGEHVPQESDMHENPDESLESEDSGSPFQPPYFVPCKSPLSKSQKRIVEERVRAIRSEVPICVAVMKNNNVGVAQRWMLELGSRYASVYLPTKGQTMVLQCGGKTWETKIMFHNGRRWFINGGWPNFARGNGLRVGDICLFELKKKEKQLTMVVHIIRKEQF